MDVFLTNKSLLAALILTIGAVAILGFCIRLPRAVAVLVGLVASVAAAIPALGTPGAEALPIVGLCALAALALLLLPTVELEFAEQATEAAGLFLLGTAGGIVLATATNLLSLVLGLETLSLSVAVLTGLGRGPRPLEAAFKFFVLAAVSLATMIYGIGLYAFATGSFELGAAMPPTGPLHNVYQAAVILTTVGFAFELAIVPVHFGALGAYMTAPAGITGFAMTASKLAAGLALLKVANGFAGPIVQPVLTVLGVVSILWATFAALAQTDLRSILGYSAIAHAGFLALAIGCGANGRDAAVFYVVVYAASAGLVFAALSGRGSDPMDLETLREKPLGTLRGVALALGLLSLAGVPPSPGFWAKLGVLLPAWHVAGPTLTILATAGGVLGALYYLKPLPDLLASLRGEPRGEDVAAGLLSRTAVAIAAVVVVMFTILPYLATQLAAYAR